MFCALDDNVIANVGDDVVRNAADGLAVLSAATSSAIARGGVLPLVLNLRPTLADGDRGGDARDGTFAVATLEPDDTNPVLSMPDTTNGTSTALPNSSSESANGWASSVPPVPQQWGVRRLARDCPSHRTWPSTQRMLLSPS